MKQNVQKRLKKTRKKSSPVQTSLQVFPGARRAKFVELFAKASAKCVASLNEWQEKHREQLSWMENLDPRVIVNSDQHFLIQSAGGYITKKTLVKRIYKNPPKKA